MKYAGMPMGMWTLFAACAPVVLAFLIMATMTGKRMVEKMRQYGNALEAMSNEAVEYVRGIPVVKTFGQSVFSFKKFKATIDEPAVILSAIYHIIRINCMIYNLEDKHIAFFKQDKAVDIPWDVFALEPWATLRHQFQGFCSLLELNGQAFRNGINRGRKFSRETTKQFSRIKQSTELLCFVKSHLDQRSVSGQTIAVI